MINLYKIPKIKWKGNPSGFITTNAIREYVIRPNSPTNPESSKPQVVCYNGKPQKYFDSVAEAREWVETVNYPSVVADCLEVVAHCEVSKPTEGFPPEQKVAFEILENTTRWLENYQNGLFNGMVYMLANLLTLRFDPNQELPTKGEYVLIQLLSDRQSTDQANLKKVYYAVDNNGEDYSHWFNDDNDEFYCEVNEVAFWWRLPKLEVDSDDQ